MYADVPVLLFYNVHISIQTMFTGNSRNMSVLLFGCPANGMQWRCLYVYIDGLAYSIMGRIVAGFC